ncbi:MAG: hypothetical protein CR982_08145 [Candidatus Cloacimonadota bacterium]|nr:MAG: hypothetical protein CR982_08145 [Candidatus Cloacimonadota bacterium]PIE77649.1 MAG: hypothetical protein CSA15_12045 [Candidatus Delongbacteria bacterium]
MFKDPENFDFNLLPNSPAIGYGMIGSVGIEENIIANIELYQNYPNPFNPRTNIGFSLEKSGEVKIEIFNRSGRLVREISNNYRSSGKHWIEWNGKDNSNNSLSSGVYYYRVSTPEGFSKIGKAVMIK